MMRSALFLREYLRPSPGILDILDVTIRRAGEEHPATLYRPARARGPLPAWVVLHGLTYTGRTHPSLVRFVRAVAASGAVVLVPDVPEWRSLRVAPTATAPTIDAAVDALAAHGLLPAQGVGVMGFSFGATQALNAVADARLAGKVATVVAWGGYHDVDALFHFGLTGEHELDGTRYQIDPDPYGRWIMAANYLTQIPGLERHGDVADALLRLAHESGRRGVHAWEPVYDPVKLKLRAELSSPAARELFDRFAPLTTSPPDTAEESLALSRALAEAAVRTEPLLDPRPRLADVRARAYLAHGRDDRLVPFTETVRLGRALDSACGCEYTVTSLFAHSGGASPGLGPIALARETGRFVSMLHRILNLV